MNLNISIGKALDSEEEIFLDFRKDNINTTVFSGPTGSGKSTFHHSITKQIIKNNTPKEVSFVFMDFKRVEYREYKDSAYLMHPIIYDPKEAKVVLKELIHESEQRYKGINDSQKAIVVHIEECDIVYFAPGLLGEVWKAIEEQSERNNMYMLFSSSKPSADVFTPELLNHSSLKGWFIPGNGWHKYYDNEINAYSSRVLGHLYEGIPEPWTRIFQLKDGKEIICRGYI